MTKPMDLETSNEVSYCEPLTDEYIATVVRDARRFQGQWCGTSGNLAAHCMRLVRERERMLEATRTDGVADGAASGAAIELKTANDGVSATTVSVPAWYEIW